MNSFIIADGRPVARLVSTLHTGGLACRFGWEKAREALNVNYEFTLVDAHQGRISAAKRWQFWDQRMGVDLPLARKLNSMVSDDQYLVGG